jgi:hypothetical protein
MPLVEVEIDMVSTCAAQETETPGTDGRDGKLDRLGFVPPRLCVMEASLKYESESRSS